MSALIEAIQNNDINTFKQLCPKNYCATLPAKYGRLDMVKYVMENKQGYSNKYSIDWANKNGHLDIVKYLEGV